MRLPCTFTLAFLLLISLFSCQPKALKTVVKDSSITKAESFPENVKTDRNIFLETAVSTGMKQDRFPKELAKKMRVNNELWIGKCPICDAVKRGLNQYISYQESNTASSSTEDSILEDPCNTNVETQKTALKKLIDNYVSQHYQRLKMTVSEISTMKTKLEAGRKQGMGGMGDKKFCASCDGACAKP